MFYLQWIYALVTFAIVTVLYLFISFRFRRRSDWIDISQAVLFRWARHGLLSMQRQKVDAKYWRPSILLLARAGRVNDDPGMMNLLRFLNRAKESGLFIIGQAHIGETMNTGTVGNLPSDPSTNSRMFTDLSTALPGLQGFPQLAVASSGRVACTNLVLGAGLGSMAPDTVAMMLPPRSAQVSGFSNLPVQSGGEFIRVMQDMRYFKKNLLIAANFDNSSAESNGRVDMWIIGDMSPLLACCLWRHRA
jgi:hypothetical protein